MQETTQTPLEAVFNFPRFIPNDEKKQYLELAEIVATANGISPEQAAVLIRSAEKDNKFKFYGKDYFSDGFRGKLCRRRELGAKKTIGTISPEEQAQFLQLNQEFTDSVERVVAKSNLDEQVVAALLEDAMLFIVTEDRDQLEGIITSGPIIEGFSDSQDYDLNDETVRDFLQAAFGTKVLRDSKVGRIKKDDEYMLIIPSNASKRFNQLLDEMVSNGLIRRFGGVTNMVIATTKQTYEQVEMILEGQTDPTALEHTYKIRASAGQSMGFSEVVLHSFAAEKPDQFDYLESLPLSNVEKMRAYILGTIVHEVAHRWESALGEAGKAMRDQVSEFISPKEGKTAYVSGYVNIHAEVYGTNSFDLMIEDFAESVRIYATNPEWLQSHFPERFALVQHHLPFLKPGMILDFVK